MAVAAPAAVAVRRQSRQRGGNRGRRDDRRGGDDDGGEELIEKLVHINRVSKTVKGGKRFGFAALVVVGDGKGRAGFGHGKAREVPEAITKATAAAKKAMVRVPLRKAARCTMTATAVSAPARSRSYGARRYRHHRRRPDARRVRKPGRRRRGDQSVGTSNPYNMIRATFEALREQTSPKSVAQRRGKKIADLWSWRCLGAEAEAEADGDRGVSDMATIKVTQTGSPIRRPDHSARR